MKTFWCVIIMALGSLIAWEKYKGTIAALDSMHALD